MRNIAIVVILLFIAGIGWTQDQTKPDALKAYKDAEKAYQETALDLQRADIRTQKREIVRALFTLNDAEEKTFWPIYDSYEKDLTKLNDERVAVIKEYAENQATLTDTKALELTTRALEYGQKRLALRKTYMDNLAKALPGIKVARILQLENQMDLLIDLQIAAEVPLVE
jgi:hypothetical protein